MRMPAAGSGPRSPPPLYSRQDKGIPVVPRAASAIRLTSIRIARKRLERPHEHDPFLPVYGPGYHQQLVNPGIDRKLGSYQIVIGVAESGRIPAKVRIDFLQRPQELLAPPLVSRPFGKTFQLLANLLRID